MKTFLEYTILEKLAETNKSVVYRAKKGKNKTNKNTVIIKFLKSDEASPPEVARFKQEYEIIKKLNQDGVLKTYDIVEDNGRIALIQENFNALSLKDILNENKDAELDIVWFLRTAITLSEIIGSLHKNNIIHKDIKPHNILFNTEKNIIKITGFGIASELTHKNHEIYSQEVLRGTLPYMSPEQTGRMNRGIDYRTDLYSLGVTFYEMLTGKVPFESNDPLEVIHSHIAQKAIPPVERNSAIPIIVSDIVMKLLKKTVEERYQNSCGLVSDLQQCLSFAEKNKKFESFKPGEKDIPLGLNIPSTLFGRKKEIQLLLSTFEQVCSTKPGEKGVGLMLVAGAPGIGKSALINEIHKPIVMKRGYFISGKYEQFGRDLPYKGIIEAFRELVRQLLRESEKKINTWRKKILDALGPNGKVIAEIIPEIELIVGKQPELTSLGAEETQNRFNLVFKNFIQVFSKKEHPLVLFLDDLQWADSASLNCMENILTNPDVESLLLIGAYRDIEVPQSHPLSITIESIRKNGLIVNEMLLSPLSITHVKSFIEEILRYHTDAAHPLAELIHQKTNGNPFFVIQFIKALHNNKTFQLTPAGEWEWDINKITRMQMTDNVVELMVDKIGKLDTNSREILKLCACVGNKFELETLSIILDKPIGAILFELTNIVYEEMICLDENVYRFYHDRIQEAAYSLIPDKEKIKIHYQIGSILLRKTSEKKLPDKILYIVNQLNYGIDLISSDGERLELARLNLMAGNKAKRSTAYTRALDLYITAINLLGKDCWKNEYNLALTLYTEAAESAYLNADYDEMERLSQPILQNSTSHLDESKLYEIKIQADISRDRVVEAVEVARLFLKKLGTRFPEKPGKLDTLLSFSGSKLILAGKKIEELIDLPPMTDPIALASINIIAHAGSVCCLGVPDVLPLYMIKQLTLSVKYGNTSMSAFGYAAYGFILCGIIGDIDGGNRFADLAENLLERLNAREVMAKTLLITYSLIRHWKIHTRETFRPLKEAYQIGLETGDLFYSSYLAFMYCSCLYAANLELSFTESEMLKYDESLKRIKQSYPRTWNRVNRQHVLNLMDQSANPLLLTGESFNEIKELPLLSKKNHKTAYFIFHFHKIELYYLFYQYSKAAEHAIAGEKYLESVTSYILQPPFYLYSSLTFLAVCCGTNAGDKTIKKKLLFKKVARNQKQMKKWAQHGPMNHLHRYYLVEAELAHATGRHADAIPLYEKAIKEARINKYIQDEAVANELAGKFHLKKGYKDIGDMYIHRAYQLYTQWGAQAKLRHMEKVYSGLFSPLFKKRDINVTGTMSTGSGTGNTSGALDLSTVIKASQAISGEIVLSKLLKRLMRLTLENAGAEKGFMVLEKDGRLLVEAEGEAGNEDARVLQSIPFEHHTGISSSIVNYTARTRQTLILNDASHEGDFTGDTFIIKNKPKSILALPITNRGSLTGILYLENDLITGAFTPERLEILKIISSQVAISIDNARLYESLAQKNTELTRLDKMKDEFLANTSHELKTPLNGIIGIAHSLLDRHGIRINDEKKANLSLILSSGKRLAGLVNDILDFSRLQNSAIELQLKKIEMSPLCELVLDLSRPLAEGKNLKLLNRIEPDLPFVEGDENRIQQILFNLVGNAIKFTDSGEISISAMVLYASGGPGFLEIRVSDSGIGIPADKQDDIFKSFEQIDGSISREYGGTGIGLSIVKQLVEIHGGLIRVESRPGEGATFSFTLPLTVDQAPMETFKLEAPIISRVREIENTETLPGSILKKENDMDTQTDQDDSNIKNKPIKNGHSSFRGTILAVDDDPVNLRVIENYLMRENYCVILVHGGAEALDRIQEEDFDLVLLDIMMPKISGYQVCRVLREKFSLHDLPILMLTAKNSITDLIAGFEAGANDYLTKPLNKEELLVRVKTLVTLRQTVRDHKEAKFKLLQDRMSPHFLFNALNMIHALMFRNVDTANQALLKLAYNYRFLMDQVLKKVIPFYEEWEFVKNYLELEELQFDDMLSTKLAAKGDFNDIFIPPLTLQPLVENAIKHGLRNKSEDGYVNLFAERAGDTVQVEILDNGVGLQKEDVFSRSLGNILQRLKYYFDDVDLTIENRKEGEGVRVWLEFSK
ncbi:MAG: AAA family ATPase [bacterium]|nr:AAA family ATPase [bacterium]